MTLTRVVLLASLQHTHFLIIMLYSTEEKVWASNDSAKELNHRKCLQPFFYDAAAIAKTMNLFSIEEYTALPNLSVFAAQTLETTWV